MRAAQPKQRPSFHLMKQTDIQSVYHMQMPRWLFSDTRYADMSLDAKVAYTFLLNRFQLSRRNGWINDRGEVFVIFPRKALAAELRICEQRVTAAFKQLISLNLVWEKRCGRGDANQIYLATVTPIEGVDYASAPFLEPESDCGCRTADMEVLAAVSADEAQLPPLQNRESSDSRAARSAIVEPQDLRPSNMDMSQKDPSYTEVSPSVPPTASDGRTDATALDDILRGCELYAFPAETALVFESAIERLFYSDSLRVGNATLPQGRVRSKLRRLDAMVLQDAECKLRGNLEHGVKNSTAYIMSTIFNCIAEREGDLLVDPYLNSLRAPPGR